MILLLILLLTINNSLSLKTSDLCLINSNRSNRNSLPCLGKYNYECRPEICSVNKDTCQDLFNLNIYLKSIHSHRKITKIKNLIKNVKECPNITYIFEPEDVCINIYGCYTRKGLNHLVGKANVNVVRKTYCPCKGKYSFSCNTKFCAISQDSCNAFMVLNSQSTRMKTCVNNFSNTIF